VVARAIGPQIASALEPYQFARPPTVHVSGVVPLEGTKDTDLRFEVDGGPFQWWKFDVPHVSGRVHWMGERMTLTNVEVAFYGGRANGVAEFDFRAENGANFQFGITATNVNLHLLMRDVAARTNRLEGLLSGRLSIDSANSVNWDSWQGGGSVNLRDGMLWEVPIFGIFSPILDGIVPGLGRTRFSEGSASFVITNSNIRSEDLQIRAPMLRMQYRGELDFQRRVDARVEAELLRDTWFIGPVVSLALWPVSKLFEYHVSGTLQEPKSEPVYYVPKFLFMPLHPFRTLRDLLPTDLNRTNAPPPVKTP
jgi:hypothetical protein